MLLGGIVSVRTQGELFVRVIRNYQHTELADVNIRISYFYVLLTVHLDTSV